MILVKIFFQSLAYFIAFRRIAFCCFSLRRTGNFRTLEDVCIFTENSSPCIDRPDSNKSKSYSTKSAIKFVPNFRPNLSINRQRNPYDVWDLLCSLISNPPVTGAKQQRPDQVRARCVTGDPFNRAPESGDRTHKVRLDRSGLRQKERNH